ncbi:MAG: TatD family hydrolase [Candidatus Pacebacteria bacterium]|nr:TatD family hydrolase [Candidatus Paceibacterota bacterium]
MVIDTHCHYNDPKIKDNLEQYWKEAQDKGVTTAILIGTNIEDSKEVIEMAQANKDFYAVIGVHPEHADQLDLNQLEQLAKEDKVIGIGEIGLDYYWEDKSADNFPQIVQKQKEVFIKQLELANKLNLPVSIHVRDKNNEAYDDVLAIIKEHTPNSNFVLHCVSGPEHYIEQMISLGAYFGFDGNVTYKNAEDIRNILRMVPNDKIVVETDAPYLPPVPYRGKVCEPWMVVVTAEYIEEEFKIDKKEFKENSKKLLNILMPTS